MITFLCPFILCFLATSRLTTARTSGLPATTIPPSQQKHQTTDTSQSCRLSLVGKVPMSECFYFQYYPVAKSLWSNIRDAANPQNIPLLWRLFTFTDTWTRYKRETSFGLRTNKNLRLNETILATGQYHRVKVKVVLTSIITFNTAVKIRVQIILLISTAGKVCRNSFKCAG